MPVKQFMKLTQMRGLHPRTERLLERDAAYEGTRYAHLDPWEPFYGVTSTGAFKYKPKRLRAPSVQAGLVKGKVNGVKRRISGEDKWATISASTEGEDGTVVTGTTELKARTKVLKDLDLRQHVILPLQDLLLKGSAVLGFSKDENGNPVIRYLPTQWCDAVFNSQVEGVRARSYANWLLDNVKDIETHLEVEGAGRDATASLKPVVGADPLDLAFLTYQWRVDEEILGEDGTKKTVITWRRRDYLPDVIIEYRPIVIRASDEKVKEWEALPLEPHHEGMVRFVWWRPEGTEPGQLDGTPLIGDIEMGISKQADYAETQRGSAYDYTAFPRMAVIDGKLEGEFQGNPRDSTKRNFSAGDPGALFRVKSQGAGVTASVQLLETSGEAIDKGILHAEKIRRDMGRVTSVEDLDRDQAGAMSGTAVQRLQEPLTAVVTQYRSDVERHIQMLWDKISDSTGQARTVLLFSWPAVLTLTAEDLTAWATGYTVARGSKLLSHRTAVIEFATKIGVEDPEAEWEAIEGEGDMMDTSTPMGGGDPDDPDDADDADEEDDPDNGGDS
jgi:hypothetical protein